MVLYTSSCDADLVRLACMSQFAGWRSAGPALSTTDEYPGCSSTLDRAEISLYDAERRGAPFEGGADDGRGGQWAMGDVARMGGAAACDAANPPAVLCISRSKSACDSCAHTHGDAR